MSTTLLQFPTAKARNDRLISSIWPGDLTEARIKAVSDSVLGFAMGRKLSPREAMACVTYALTYYNKGYSAAAAIAMGKKWVVELSHIN